MNYLGEKLPGGIPHLEVAGRKLLEGIAQLG